MRPSPAAALLLLMAGCMSAQIHSMARTVRIADSRFSDEYADASGRCLASAPAGHDGWAVYDACMAGWYEAYAAMRVLISTTLALDVARGRDEFRDAGCRWYRSMSVLDALTPVELPSIKTGLSSRWRKRCK